MVMMQGILWKWTNYLSGWQPRWFVLDYGVLAYYRSQEEVHLGSRGSIKLSCCEILVHPTDPVRLDLKIPPESHMYLRAASSAERQQWLVALGTSKACRVDTSYEEQQQQMNSMTFLKDKMSELNTCRNIIVQQVHQLKSVCANDQHDKSKEMSEASTLLSATCDTFLSNLSDMMEVFEDSLSTASGSPVSTPIRIKNPPHFKKHHNGIGTPSPTSPSSIFSDSIADFDRAALSPSDKPIDNQHNSKTPTLLIPPNSLEVTKNQNIAPKKNDAKDEASAVRNGKPQAHVETIASPDSTPTTATTSTSTSMNESTPLYALSQQSLDSHSPEELEKPQPRTFFSLAPARFEDVEISVDGRIPTKPFLEACSSILPVFDILGSTAFAPVRIDIQGNIKKIRSKYETDDHAFVHLQNMVFQELKSNTCSARNSTTDALLWLKRALEFIHVFLAEICRGEQDLAVAATNAYGRSLRKYHGWVVRGVFSLAVKAVPYRKDFIAQLGTVENSGEPASETEIINEMKSCVMALGKLVNILCQFYKRHRLDNESVV